MNTTMQWPNAISKRKKNLIMQLIFRNIIEKDKREQWLEKLESAYEDDADEIVQSLLE